MSNALARGRKRLDTAANLYMKQDPKISDLTVSQLQRLIRETVQEAVAEVMIEFHAVAQAEEQLRYEAEMTDFLRSTMHGASLEDLLNLKLDD